MVSIIKIINLDLFIPIVLLSEYIHNRTHPTLDIQNNLYKYLCGLVLIK